MNKIKRRPQHSRHSARAIDSDTADDDWQELLTNIRSALRDANVPISHMPLRINSLPPYFLGGGRRLVFATLLLLTHMDEHANTARADGFDPFLDDVISAAMLDISGDRAKIAGVKMFLACMYDKLLTNTSFESGFEEGQDHLR